MLELRAKTGFTPKISPGGAKKNNSRHTNFYRMFFEEKKSFNKSFLELQFSVNIPSSSSISSIANDDQEKILVWHKKPSSFLAADICLLLTLSNSSQFLPRRKKRL